MPERSMLDLDLAEAIRATPKPVPAKKSFTVQALKRAALWGATAAGALMIAVLASRSEVGAQRLAGILPLRNHGTQVAFNAETETRRLADAIRFLAANDDQFKARLATVERNMDDMTGSVSRQIAAAEAKPARAFEMGPTVQATAAVVAAMTPPTTAPPAVEAAAPAATSQTEYGADIGSGLTIQALRLRWAAIHAAHPQLFEGLAPIVTIKEASGSNKIELRLVVGPFARPGAATQLCAALTPFGLFCQPTIYAGQHLAMQ
jgi:hypothetical protein